MTIFVLSVEPYGKMLKEALVKQLSNHPEDITLVDQVYRDLWNQFFINFSHNPFDFIKLLNGLPEFSCFPSVKSLTDFDTTELVNLYKEIAFRFYHELHLNKLMRYKGFDYILRDAAIDSVSIMISEPETGEIQ